MPRPNYSPPREAERIAALEEQIRGYRDALQKIAAPTTTFWEAQMARRMAAIAREALRR